MVELLFEFKAQNHQSYDAWVQKDMTIFRNAAMMPIVGVKEALNCLRIHLVIRDHQDLEFLISTWIMESHKLVTTWGEFEPTLEDVLNLMALPLYGETNPMSVSLGKEDEDYSGWLPLLAIPSLRPLASPHIRRAFAISTKVRGI